MLRWAADARSMQKSSRVLFGDSRVPRQGSSRSLGAVNHPERYMKISCQRFGR